MPEQPPIQPVEKPILCKPYEEPNDHWLYDRKTGKASHGGTRRPAQYLFRTERIGSSQLELFAQENHEYLPLVNLLRADVRRFREKDYPGVSNVSRELLRHWANADRHRRLFFCQREAVETVIYLAEVCIPGRTGSLRFKPDLGKDELQRLLAGQRPFF
jgi:type III restriction enzyme